MPEVEQAILRLPDYTYYLENAQGYEDYKRAKIIVDAYGNRNATGAGLGYLAVV